MNNNLSKQIYRELIVGKYINGTKLNDSNIKVDNNLYIEISQNFNEYEKTYERLGYKLLQGEDFDYYYLRKEEIEEEQTEQELDKILIKEYVLCLSLCRYLLDNKKGLEIILNNDLGVTRELLEDFLNDSKYQDIFQAAEITTEKSDPINQLLERKNILEKNKNNNYIGTEIFKDFVNYQEKLGHLLQEEMKF